jgi:NAD(P)-dependent dehydrogenase (short-subunit alcohol dehydrogenase family)
MIQQRFRSSFRHFQVYSLSISTNVKDLISIRSANQNKILSGTKALIVGGTAGIGEGIARRLAKAKVAVTIAGRNATRGNEIVQELSQISGGNEQHKFISVNCLLMKSIDECCSQYQKESQNLDFLVMTQGIATTQGRTETKEGIDQKLQLHYFGRMFFIHRLLPLLQASSRGGKVLSVFSAGVHPSYPQYQTDFELKKVYTLASAACAPGMYTDLCLEAFSKQSGNEKLAFIHASPGGVNSNWGKELPFLLRMVINIAKPIFGKSIDDAGELMSDCLLSNDIGPGNYLFDEFGNPTKRTDLHSDQARDFVWKETKEVIQRALNTYSK